MARNSNRTPAANNAQDAPATSQELEPVLEQTPDAPATEQELTADAPAGAPATSPEQDAPAAAADPEPEPEPEPTALDYLALSVTADAAQSVREDALATAIRMMLRSALGTVAALPDDMPVLADTLHFRVNGASGRGVAAARAILAVAAAMFGGGYYVGSTHGSIKGTTADSDRRMKVNVTIPSVLAPFFAALVEVMENGNGPLVAAEQAAYTAARLRIKASGIPAGQTEYGLVNKSGRAAIALAAQHVTEMVRADFPADDPDIAHVRALVSASRSELARVAAAFGITRNITPVTDRYDVPAPAVTAAA